MARLSVLIPVYRGSMQLEPLLEALRRDPYPDKEVVVVADAPLPETRGLPERHPETRFIFNEERVGKVDALNGAVPQTDGEYLLFLDADVEVRQDGFLGRVVEALDEYELVDIKKMIVRDSPLARLVSYDYLSSSLTNLLFSSLLGRSPQLNGAAFAVRRGTLQRLGGFPKAICEDLEMAFAAYTRGVSFRFAEDIEVHNAVDPSLGRWVVQRRRWGIGLAHWITGHIGALLVNAARNPHVFVAALLVIFPSAPLIVMSFLLPNGLYMKLLSLVLMLLSGGHVLLVPPVYAIALSLMVAKVMTATTMSFVGTGVAFYVASRRLGYRFNVVEYTAYFLFYNPAWFLMTVMSLIHVLVRRGSPELDWKV
ncbi:MAG TPA: glycosyltransferase family 2 protein [Candidatus Krumholzibacteriaceae bacterium]|nr:glycosyltransferase family 2 protein [Candidatus Krumholzibacteriaceae bacterium]